MNKDNQIMLTDMLNLSEGELSGARVRLMVSWGENPLDIFLRNPAEINDLHLLNRKSRRDFSEGCTVIALVRMASSNDSWLFTGARTITKVLDKPREDGVGYEAEDIERLVPYFGRVVVHYHNSTQRMIRDLKGIRDELVVTNVLPNLYEGEPFPGFDKVCLTYEKLKSILDHERADWINAFRSQKAVYLITDTSNGKLYVGSATAGGDAGMLLRRWREYAEGQTGGNQGLVELVREMGSDYVKSNFQYSILENYNERTSDDFILSREQWWKRVLCSREHGYNRN